MVWVMARARIARPRTITNTTIVQALVKQIGEHRSSLGKLPWFRVQPSYVRVLSSGHGWSLGQLTWFRVQPSCVRVLSSGHGCILASTITACSYDVCACSTLRLSLSQCIHTTCLRGTPNRRPTSWVSVTFAVKDGTECCHV